MFMAFDRAGGGLNEGLGLNASVTRSLGAVVSSLEPANVVNLCDK